ncbi:hypothetical protein [Bacillus sp. FJAT-28004]|uniref:hypothetical protein n=1 Tax=Bacillus sp. FJAT-28004 TaxID=1679165 RepID=UPI0006B56F69|nr:hypothetical protein [Bacillus sp. FJAT-28004]
MKQGQIVYSFFIVDQGLLYLESLFMTEDQSEAERYARSFTAEYLVAHGYDGGGLEKETDDGYAMIVKSRYGVAACVYQELIWNYRMDGKETINWEEDRYAN